MHVVTSSTCRRYTFFVMRRLPTCATTCDCLCRGFARASFTCSVDKICRHQMYVNSKAMKKDDLASRLFRACVPIEWLKLCMLIYNTVCHFIVVRIRKKRKREREKEYVSYIATVVGHTYLSRASGSNRLVTVVACKCNPACAPTHTHTLLRA